MKRSIPRIGIIVLFACLLMMFNAYPVISHAASVEFDVLNEPIVDITEDDLLQLRRVDDDSVVSASETHGAPSGEVSLDTSNALREEETEVALKVVYVLDGESGGVIATGEETVYVQLEPVKQVFLSISQELHAEATWVNRKEYIGQFISMLDVMPTTWQI